MGNEDYIYCFGYIKSLFLLAMLLPNRGSLLRGWTSRKYLSPRFDLANHIAQIIDLSQNLDLSIFKNPSCLIFFYKYEGRVTQTPVALCLTFLRWHLDDTVYGHSSGSGWWHFQCAEPLNCWVWVWRADWQYGPRPKRSARWSSSKANCETSVLILLSLYTVWQGCIISSGNRDRQS